MKESIEFSLGSLARLLELELDGESDEIVSGLATLVSAQEGQLSFYTSSRYLSDLCASKASAMILHPRDRERYKGNKLLSTNPYLSYAKASQLFCKSSKESEHNAEGSIHDSAIVDASAKIGKNVNIDANAVISKEVILADNVRIGANCVIEQGAEIGANSVLHGNVTIYSSVCIGMNVIIHSAAVIGSDGFGYASDGKKYHKIAQLGGVRIENDVEIGASSCIDRGALDDTVIEAGVKIDNQVQIAHNVRVGANTVICGCSAVAGSSTIGENCVIAGGVGIINNVTIADGVTVTAMSLVNQSIEEKGVYSSGTGLSETSVWKKNIVRFRQLGQLFKRVRDLEKNSK